MIFRLIGIPFHNITDLLLVNYWSREKILLFFVLIKWQQQWKKLNLLSEDSWGFVSVLIMSQFFLRNKLNYIKTRHVGNECFLYQNGERLKSGKMGKDDTPSPKKKVLHTNMHTPTVLPLHFPTIETSTESFVDKNSHTCWLSRPWLRSQWCVLCVCAGVCLLLVRLPPAAFLMEIGKQIVWTYDLKVLTNSQTYLHRPTLSLSYTHAHTHSGELFLTSQTVESSKDQVKEKDLASFFPVLSFFLFIFC